MREDGEEGIRIESHLARYLEALAGGRPSREGAAVVEGRPEERDGLAILGRELLPGLYSLARRGYAPFKDLLHGEAGLDLCHEAFRILLEGRLEGRPGELLRLLDRAAYASFRKDRRRTRPFEPGEESRLPAPSAPRPEPPLPPLQEPWVERILDESLAKKRGGLHLGRFARSCGLSEKKARLLLRGLERTLGRTRATELFWLRRLGEALVQLLRLKTEAEVGDLLPSAGREEGIHARLQRALDRLSRTSLPAGPRRALTRTRALCREGGFPRAEVREVALLLVTDPMPVELTQVEWLRSRGRLAKAGHLLDSLEGMAPPGHPRRRFLLLLARTRLLEAEGRPEEAWALLEAQAPSFRGDALFCYDRLVLARASGREEDRARRDLSRFLRAPGNLSPLLLGRIRTLLAP